MLRTTEQLHERAQRLEEAISLICGPVKVRAMDDGSVEEEVSEEAGGMIAGPIAILNGAGNYPVRVVRTHRFIDEGEPHLVKVFFPLRGTVAVEQDDDKCLTGPGRLLAFDNGRPYELRFRGSYDFMSLGIPQRMLGTHVSRLMRQGPASIPVDARGQRLAASLLRGALRQPDLAATEDSSPYLADALVSLVLAAADRRPPRMPGAGLANRVMSYCLAHLNDPDLSVESVAHEHNVSVRQLNRVMGANGIKLAAWIRGQRLERIRRDLADPSLAGRSAERIAADWGILDASHISRAMRAEFGQNASQIRRTAISKRDAQDIVTEAQASRD